jgi:hypothetical protein
MFVKLVINRVDARNISFQVPQFESKFLRVKKAMFLNFSLEIENQIEMATSQTVNVPNRATHTLRDLLAYAQADPVTFSLLFRLVS